MAHRQKTPIPRTSEIALQVGIPSNAVRAQSAREGC
jgi:hypothetical protein